MSYTVNGAELETDGEGLSVQLMKRARRSE